MQKLDFQRRPAAKSAELFEMCPPKVSVGLRGGNGARHEVCLRQYHEFDNLGGKPNETITFSLICVLTFIGIALSVSSVTADDRDRDGNDDRQFWPVGSERT